MVVGTPEYDELESLHDGGTVGSPGAGAILFVLGKYLLPGVGQAVLNEHIIGYFVIVLAHCTPEENAFIVVYHREGVPKPLPRINFI